MADEKLNTGPGEEKLPEAPAPVTADGPQAPAPEQAAAPTPQQEGPAQPEPGDVVVSFDKINELMNEKRQTARTEVEKEEAAKEPEEKTQEEPPAVGDGEPKKARRGRPPKEEKAEPADKEAAKPRKGRPPKADKAAPGEATPTKRDKLSRSGKKAAEVKAAPEPEKAPPENAAPAPEQAPPEPAAPPRPVEEGKLVYLKLSEMHPFHTFRPHPFKVRDDAKMQETVASIEPDVVYKAVSPRSLQYQTEKYIIFPYKYDGSGLVRFTANEFEKLFPNATKHLKRFSKELAERDSDKNAAWFEYGRSQALSHINTEKLLVSTITTRKVEIHKIGKDAIPYSGIYITVKNSDYSLDDAISVLRSNQFMEYIRRIGISVNGKSIRITCKDINDFRFVGGQ